MLSQNVIKLQELLLDIFNRLIFFLFLEKNKEFKYLGNYLFICKTKYTHN